jgi:hypothetical protein
MATELDTAELSRKIMYALRMKSLGIFILMMLLAGCGQAENVALAPEQPPIVIGNLDIATASSRNLVFPYTEDVPEFPVQIESYSLKTQEGYQATRLFENDDWIVAIPEFNPETGGSATMSCQPFYWVIRWRSNNPDVEIQVSTGLTDGPYDPSDNIEFGGAGVSEGFSCFVPAFKFGRGINGNPANLVDLNFEYQIWEYRPKI